MVKCYKKDYPRPQFVRDNWTNLNGEWDFSFDDDNIGEYEQWYKFLKSDKKINVPFTYETKLSGICDESIHNYVWYQKKLDISKNDIKDNNLFLHIEGSDYITKVWLNGTYLGCHEGGYSRFSFNLSNALKEDDNILIIKVEDSLNESQPRGKQRWTNHSYGCWYVQTTGIWKTVWLEVVPKNYIESVKITPNLQDSSVLIDFNIENNYNQDLYVETTVSFEDKLVNKCIIPVLNKNIHTKINLYNTNCVEWGVFQWTPSSPNLYDISFKLIHNNEIIDNVNSYFGLREIKIDGCNILLNGVPIYQRLILDQGYWKDSHLTPPSEEAIIQDIEKILQLGYNGLRKHQKIEDERFLYWCDVKGVLVWSEMAATYHFNDFAVESFTKQWIEIVKQNYNHPSIITWTPFNESWGVEAIKNNITQQQFTQAIYYLTKSLDSTRPVIVNDGWEHTISDIITLHDYEQDGKTLFDRYFNNKEDILSSKIYHNGFKSAFANNFTYKGQPIIISEFGGIAFNNEQQGWGYGDKVKDETDFLIRFDNITTSIKKLPFICGYCYTQVTDVQQEINGLMDMERNFKVDANKIYEINTRPVNK